MTRAAASLGSVLKDETKLRKSLPSRNAGT